MWFAMTLRLDHVVILVHDLEAAQAQYRDAGFTLVYGGQHTGGHTHNALIVFQDGSYLELLAPTNSTMLQNEDYKRPGSFLSWFAAGAGFGGFALHSSDLLAEVTRIRQHNIQISLGEGGRKRADGQALHWRSGFLDSGLLLPFYIEDVTPRTLRVSDDPMHTTHPNGARGMHTVIISSSQFDADGHLYNALLGQQGRMLANRMQYTMGASTVILQPAIAAGRRIVTVELSGESDQLLDGLVSAGKLMISSASMKT
jgi:catechol 2,3-dioxygenase-like lactoylglutathione lyase family enzyme